MTAPPEQFPETYLLRCVDCGYALRGLPPESQCPECGLGIRQTLAIVARARHPWLAAVVRGISNWLHRPLPALARNDRRWLRTVAPAPLTLALLIPVVVVWSWWRETVPWQFRVPEYPLLWMALAFAAAVWLLTRPDRPRQRPADALWSSVRWALRTLSLSPALAAGLAAYSEVVPAHDHRHYANQAIALLPLTPAVAFLLFDYLAYLGARAWTEWVAWFFRASMLLVTPVLAAWVTVVLRGTRYYDPPDLYPDAVGLLAQFGIWGWGVAWMYTGLLWVALLRLAVAIWVLPDDPVKE